MREFVSVCTNVSESVCVCARECLSHCVTGSTSFSSGVINAGRTEIQRRERESNLKKVQTSQRKDVREKNSQVRPAKYKRRERKSLKPRVQNGFHWRSVHSKKKENSSTR